eukprot:8275825-Alexandrium_andersonii.AAC.1
MSASLVGSEMCIRDRRYSHGASSFERESWGGGPAAFDSRSGKGLRRAWLRQFAPAMLRPWPR